MFETNKGATMTLRFRKTVSLGKGARINFGKSGASFSLGPRGASISIGKRGTYANVGIPGSGLSIRTKIDGASGGSRRGDSHRAANAATSISPERQYALEEIRSHVNADGSLPLKAGVNDLGEIYFQFTDTTQDVRDKAVIRELQKLPEVKEALAGLQEEQRKIWRELQSSSEEASREFIDIYKMTPKVVTAKTFTNRLNKLSRETYQRVNFTKSMPTQQEMRSALEAEAAKNVTGLFGRKRKVEAYVNENWDSFSKASLDAWQHEKLEFDSKQDIIEKAKNARFAREYEEKKASFERALAEDDETIAELVEDWLSNLTIPADVSAQIHCQSGKVYIDLDLPEIEDLPSTTTKQLKSGQVKVVNKPQKKLKEEYATCVLGLAFFIAGNTFNLNANIKEVEISGYTQRRNRGGDIDDDYIYSVRFPREEFRKNPVNDPLRDFNEFENRMKLSSAFTFGKIKPYNVPVQS